MIISQAHIKSGEFSQSSINDIIAIDPQLMIVFSSLESLVNDKINVKLFDCCSNCTIIGCSTSGEISQDGVFENSAVITGIHFDNPDFRVQTSELPTMNASYESGKLLARGLYDDKLNSVFILGLGVNINGSALIEGLDEIFNNEILITGGLAGDNGEFKKTYTFLNNEIYDDRNLGIGFYNDRINFGYGSAGGWHTFGPQKKITRSSKNILYEIDGKPALEVYKKYLGEFAKDLPASALLFPFLLLDEKEHGLVRTILGIDENKGSLLLAGDVIENGYIKLMQASTESLVAGAQKAAQNISKEQQEKDSGLAILVSCVGRKLVMGGRIDEEIDAIDDVFSSNTFISGFYSYGEICPHSGLKDCKLHNQTMTITYISEK